MAFFSSTLFYVVYGNFGGLLSQVLLGAWTIIIFACSLRYMKNIEGRRPRKLLFYSLLFWGLAYIVENITAKVGLLGGHYEYNSNHLISLGLSRVPLIIPTAWLIFSYLNGSVTHYIFERSGKKASFSPFQEFLLKSVLSGLVMVSIDFALEWHFSQLAAFWKWHLAEGSSSQLYGVPLGNFFLWFGMGFFIPLSEFITRAPKRTYNREAKVLKALPTIGFGFFLLASAITNLVFNFWGAFLLCLLSLGLLVFILTLGVFKKSLLLIRWQVINS